MTAPVEASRNRHSYGVLPPVRMQGTDLPWAHDVHVALPPSYDDGANRDYPVLWVTDGSLSFGLVVGLLNWLTTTQETGEPIVVGVGVPEDSSHDEFTSRRSRDFFPAPPRPDAATIDAEPGRGGAQALLSYLVDELRPHLAAQFRFADDHGIVGYSDGGLFVGFALLARPSAFRRFLAASPALAGSDDLLFTLEADYAAGHDDLAADVFFGVGEAELVDPFLAELDIVGSTARMTQLLRVRGYPSLALTCRIYPGQTHGSALPYVLGDGLRTLYPRSPG